MIKELCNGQVNAGLTVGIAFALREEAPADFRSQLDPRIQLYELNEGRTTGRGGQVQIEPLQDFRMLLRVVRIVFAFRPDIIHAHSSKAGLAGRLAGLVYRGSGARVGVVYSPHGFAFLREDVSEARRWLFLLLERIGYRFGGVIVGCSAGEAAIARERIGKSRVAVVENAVNLSEVPLKASKPDRSPIVVVTTGRISPQKNPELFATVARSLSDQPIMFRWIGGGATTDEVKLRQLPGVVVTGWLPRSAALQELTKADIYLQTSRWEGMSVSLIEGMVCGLPAVVTDVVGNRDVVCHGESGFIGRSEQDLVQFLLHLAADDTLRARMGARAREIAIERFALPRLLEQWRRVYMGVGPEEWSSC